MKSPALPRVWLPAFLLALLCACTVGPRYSKPDVANLVPADWRWKVAEPKDAAPKGEWWKVFDDPVLDELERGAVANNQTLRAAVGRVDEARAAARLARSPFFPEVSLDPSARRERTSGNLPTPIPIKPPAAHVSTFSIPLDLSYELDLWGRVRRSFESAQAQAQASVADYENVLLTLTADVAINYFLLRALDTESAALRRTVESRSQSLRIQSERVAAGTLSGVELEHSRTELATAETSVADVRRQRAELLHALAVLCGKSPSAFEIPERPLVETPFAVPAGLPSALLERRPDIARAEKSLAARNAQIGVARAAYFPAVHLTGQGGFLSNEARSLISSDSRVWSIGPRVSVPLFTGGRTAADVRRAEAAYETSLAEYRQTVLVAFREVEDSLAQIALRNEQAKAQADAHRSARHAAALIRARYDVGTLSYLELADADRSVLEQERRQAQLHGQRLAASVRLIKALGGGWGSARP